MGLTGKTQASTYKDILQIENNNTGVDSTSRAVKTGSGTASCVSLGTNNLIVSPSADTTTTMRVGSSSGTLLTVDGTNGLVKAGYGQVVVSRQESYFGRSNSYTVSANTHVSVPFNFFPTAHSSSLISIGTGTDPDAGITHTTTADHSIGQYMFVNKKIIIDDVTWMICGNGSGTDTVRAHLMSYDLNTGSTATGGDWANGVVIADGADISQAGYNSVDTQTMTIQEDTIDGTSTNKALVFVVRADSVNNDHTVQCKVGWHYY